MVATDDSFVFISTLTGMLVVASVLALIFGILTVFVMPVLGGAVRRQVWWPRAIEPQRQMLLNYGFNRSALTEEHTSTYFAWVCFACVHHIVASSFMLPVLLSGWEQSATWKKFLFVFGTLVDVGFDIQDEVLKTFTMLVPSTSLGPTPFAAWVILCCLHHPLALSLVIPMNLYYPHLHSYHAIVVSLLGAAGVCFLTGQYKFTLETKSQVGFLQYKVIVFIQLVTVLYSRVLVWYPCLYAALSHFYAVGDMVFFYGGGCMGTLMSLFNIVILVDSIKAAAKWLPKPMPTKEEHREELAEDIAIPVLSPMGENAPPRLFLAVSPAKRKFKAAVHVATLRQKLLQQKVC